MYRQGDILLVPVDVPAEVKLVPKAILREIVLAEGEATGHRHVLRGPRMALLEGLRDRYVRVPRAAALEHEEHARLDIPRGLYRVVIQREYTGEEARPVAD